jgi:hypothetical protein
MGTIARLHHGSRRTDCFASECFAAWRKFVACVEVLPADQAAPLWQTVQAQSVKALESVKPVCVVVA